MRLIDADELQQLFNAVSSDLLRLPELTKDAEHMVRAFLMATEMIRDASTIEAEPVRHGRWTWERNEKIELSYGVNAYEPIFRCSCCGRITESYLRFDEPIMRNNRDADFPNYCPKCGARMDEMVEE